MTGLPRGRNVALHHRASTSYQIREANRCLLFRATTRSNPRRAGAGIPAAEQAAVDGMLCRTMLPGRLRELGVQAVIDADPGGREIYMEEGDLLLLVRAP